MNRLQLIFYIANLKVCTMQGHHRLNMSGCAIHETVIEGNYICLLNIQFDFQNSTCYQYYFLKTWSQLLGSPKWPLHSNPDPTSCVQFIERFILFQ